jgi:geranylgeranyl diphosphate synthase, type I
MTTTHETARSAGQVLEWGRELVEPALREAIDTFDDPIRHIAGYHFGWWDRHGRPATPGGKGLRPALALLAAEAAGGRPEQAIPAAAAVELVHNFSLLHDDVMDGDATRRHRATAWHVFGVGPAVLTGDTLLTLAVDVLVAAGGPVRVLTTAVLDLLAGQSSDMAFERRTDVGYTECLAMATAKTASLMRCACALGAAAGGASPDATARLGLFGELLGLAFQHADDLLGIWGDPATTGKPVHSDLVNRKKSLPVVAALTSGTPAGDELAGLYHGDGDVDAARAAALIDAAGGRDRSRRHVTRLIDEALTTLNDTTPAGRARAELTTLAQLVTRSGHER